MRKIFAIIVSCVSFTSALYGAGCVGDSNMDRGNWGFYGRVDALGWKANQLGIQYAQTDNAINSINGSMWAPETGFRGAFRIGGGYVTECTGWALESYWTHFYQKSSITKEQFQVIALAPIVGIANELNSTASFVLNFNTVDLMLRKSFYAAPCFSWEPHMGVQGIMIREQEVSSSDGGAGLTTTTTVDSNFNGLGMTAGLGVNWDLFKCWGSWSFVGDTTVTLATGKTFYSLRNDPTSPLANQFSHYNYQEVRPIYDMKLGLAWESCLCSCFPLSFDLVWESMYLPNTFKSSPKENFAAVPASGGFFQPGDLSFSGVTLTCRLGF